MAREQMLRSEAISGPCGTYFREREDDGPCPCSLSCVPLSDSCEILQEKMYTAEYGDTCYVLDNRRLPWEEARHSCEASGGRLARLENSEKYEYVMNGYNYFKGGKRYRAVDIFVYIDGRRINGKLYWTNGELMTFSKPTVFLQTPISTEMSCILASSFGFDYRDCDSQTHLCEHVKRPIPMQGEPQSTSSVIGISATELTTSSTSADQTTSHSVELSGRVTARGNQKRNVKRKPALKEKVAKILGNGLLVKDAPLLETKVHFVTMCSRECLIFQGCDSFNFNKETGECRGYHIHSETDVESTKYWDLWGFEE